MMKHPTTRPTGFSVSCCVIPSSWGLACFVIPPCPGFLNFGHSLAFISPGGGELIMIMLVLILLFGAKDAPRIFRSIQTFLDKMQRNAADFRYKMMYGDLHANTTDEEPYDQEDQESGVRDQKSGVRNQGAGGKGQGTGAEE